MSGKIAVYYVLPTDATYDAAEFAAVKKISRELQAWYRANTGGVTYTFAEADTVIVYNALQASSYYASDWWNLLLAEMQDQGAPIFQNGTVASLWVKSFNKDGLIMGAQGCEGACGAAMAAIENIPDFNAECPSGTGEAAFPCVPHGVMGHSLGHAFGLVHPFDITDTKEVANHSIMQTYWNYPDLAPETNQPWGLLTVERSQLRANMFFGQEIPAKPTYEPSIVNLPVQGNAPAIALDVATEARTANFANTTEGANLFYWTFGDGTTSNEKAPSHTYVKSGTYTATLYASSSTSMMAKQSIEVQVSNPLAVDSEVDTKHYILYPNPSHDGLFRLQLPAQTSASELTVSNVLGKHVLTTTAKALQENITLDLRHFAQGTYYLRLKLKDKTHTLKLIRL
ncbi:T9SS type A sorting domain-containing protein [Pontibacter oryzae]|nr:T9SS type A sorting domain-containing protein [Pontibacter oryzae]